jgi:hypothetical protein
MALMGADAFFAQYTNVRFVWIRGEVGSGKSLFAVVLMKELLRRGAISGVIANMPTVLPLPDWRGIRNPEELEGLDPESPEYKRKRLYNLGYNIGLIGDEFWQFVDNRTSMSNSRIYSAFPRKYNNYWAFSSTIPIDKRLSYLSLERTSVIVIPGLYSLVRLLRRSKILTKLMGPLRYLGSEVWRYDWIFEMGYKQNTGHFYLLDPNEYFGTYETGHVPRSDAGISELLMRTVEQSTRNDPDEGRWWYEPTDEDYNDEDEEGDSDLTAGVGRVRGTALRLLGENQRGAASSDR